MSADLAGRIVVDASVLLKVFSPEQERHAEAAIGLLDALDDGRIAFVAPQLLELELLNVAARKWLLEEAGLLVLVRALEDMRIERWSPGLERVVHWSTRGLSSYDAAYVAVAEEARVPLVTDDEQIVAVASEVAVPLGSL